MANDWPPEFGDDLRADVLEAVERARSDVRWKSGKDVQHHKKRIRLGHLSPKTTLDEYESIIAKVLNSNDAELYLFLFDKTPYPSILTNIEDKDWLVMIGLDGVIETAFPPDNSESYLSDPAFVYIGLLEGLRK